jgi:hypothetical protein
LQPDRNHPLWLKLIANSLKSFVAELDSDDCGQCTVNENHVLTGINEYVLLASQSILVGDSIFLITRCFPW